MSIDEAKCVNADLVDRLRRLADMLEREDVPDLYGFAGLLRDGDVMIDESVFRKWFAGQSVSGQEDGCIVDVSAEACGIMFTAVISDSEDSRVRDVIIQL